MKFYDEQIMAIQQLSIFVKAMYPKRHDAAVFRPGGMIANAKAFLDENEQYVERSAVEIAILDKSDESIFIVGNPFHCLGFIVASPLTIRWRMKCRQQRYQILDRCAKTTAPI